MLRERATRTSTFDQVRGVLPRLVLGAGEPSARERRRQHAGATRAARPRCFFSKEFDFCQGHERERDEREREHHDDDDDDDDDFYEREKERRSVAKEFDYYYFYYYYYYEREREREREREKERLASRRRRRAIGFDSVPVGAGALRRERGSRGALCGRVARAARRLERHTSSRGAG